MVQQANKLLARSTAAYTNLFDKTKGLMVRALLCTLNCNVSLCLVVPELW